MLNTFLSNNPLKKGVNFCQLLVTITSFTSKSKFLTLYHVDLCPLAQEPEEAHFQLLHSTTYTESRTRQERLLSQMYLSQTKSLPDTSRSLTGRCQSLVIHICPAYLPSKSLSNSFSFFILLILSFSSNPVAFIILSLFKEAFIFFF